jgi:hypothetical protein
MCLRVNRIGRTPPVRVRGDDEIQELEMREPPGYLGTIVRRIKRRALMERDARRQAEARRMKAGGRLSSRIASLH